MGFEDHHGEYHQHDQAQRLTQNARARREAVELGRRRVTRVRELDLIPQRRRVLGDRNDDQDRVKNKRDDDPQRSVVIGIGSSTTINSPLSKSTP